MIAEKFLADHNFTFKDGIFHQGQLSNSDFESVYIDIRKKEGRLLSDTDVLKLPQVDARHPHAKEWKIRKRSASRLVEYLNEKNGEKSILEIGCGNGWLGHHLSWVKNAQVIGVDVNVTELEQASIVFQRIPNLIFIAADVFTLTLPVKINYVVLASSVQYFPNLTSLINTLSNLLSHDGEIHILDSPFYGSNSVDRARERSNAYFTSQNSNMGKHYYHHAQETLSDFNVQILYNPTSLVSRLKNKFQLDSPFPWIRIKKI